MTQPIDYLINDNTHRRSHWLATYISKHFKKDISIVELGCGVGRNLMHLYGQGFREIYGFDIFQPHIDLGRNYFPHLKIYKENLNHFTIQADLIFTIAVLQHVENIDYSHIVEGCDALITVEDEKRKGPIHFPRNYKKVFEPLGMRQINTIENVSGLSHNFIMRHFVKETE